ncbi:MAG: metallophosphoesterase [Dermatophilaceae bacterium]
MAPSPAHAGTHLLVAAAGLTLLAACSTIAPPAGQTGASGASLTEPAALTAITPAPTTERPTVVAFITDYGNCDAGEIAVADMVDTWDAAAIVTGGDNTQSYGDCLPYEQSVEPYYADYLAPSDPPLFFPALGNHDYTNPGAGLAAYTETFPHVPTDDDPQGRWYDQTIGDLTFFVLDSEAPPADQLRQQAWLQDALAEADATAPGTWHVVVFHRPAHSSGTHGSFAPMQEAAGWQLQEWGADLVLAGHQHIYEDVVVDGLHHVTGTTGALDTVRQCPAERVEGSRVCVAGAGALRLTATSNTLHVELHLADDPGTAADRITLER